jgi:hypothetical protein
MTTSLCKVLTRTRGLFPYIESTTLFLIFVRFLFFLRQRPDENLAAKLMDSMCKRGQPRREKIYSQCFAWGLVWYSVIVDIFFTRTSQCCGSGPTAKNRQDPDPTGSVMVEVHQPICSTSVVYFYMENILPEVCILVKYYCIRSSKHECILLFSIC